MKRFKFSELLTVILFCAILASFSVSFLLLPDKEYSEQEKRPLEQLPELNGENFFSGKYAKDINTYFADQFPLRNLFVKLKSSAELAFLKGENNGVLYSYGQLAMKDFPAKLSSRHPDTSTTPDTDRVYLKSVEVQLKAVNSVADKLKVPMVTVLPPRTIDIVDSVFDYDRPDGDAVFELMNATLSEKTGYVDTLSLLRPKYEQGEYVYYRTDHHWTTEGAYAIYTEIMKQLNCEDRIIPRSDFTVETVDGFSGSTAANGNFPFYKKDEVEIWHLDDDDSYTVIADGEDIGGFYSYKYLESSDQYSIFLDGTHGKTEITKNGEERKTLLVVKDSFANCLIPFLAREFNIIALDLATNLNISYAVEEYNADAVLVVYNVENIIKSVNLSKIR
jgi:hypothetical protein